MLSLFSSASAVAQSSVLQPTLIDAPTTIVSPGKDRADVLEGQGDLLLPAPEPDSALVGDEPRQGISTNAQPAAHVDLTPLLTAMNRQSERRATPASVPADEEDAGVADERYHWKGLLWQSFAFISTEDGFRLMTDPYMRHLTADKPYWHDYIASLKQWNMRRWWDGDDFLVDFVGHPMQGGVSSFLAIQNSPKYRTLELSGDREYWKSRFWGMMWATVFSTQQKIGPLGEAALGSDGGYTYPLNCSFPCANPKARYTNNTGWTDFIATPAVGALWGLGEDFLDRYVSDRIQGDNRRAVLPKILRGTLNPCRTMANAMRWRMPWYRDFQDPNPYGRLADVHFLHDDDFLLMPRVQIAPHFNALSLPVNAEGCVACRRITRGGGVELSYRLGRWADFDSDLSSQPNASPLPSERAGGSLLLGTFGFRSGFQSRHYALRASIRPGFASYSRAELPSASGVPEMGRITHFTTALTISTDYQVTRWFGLRSSFGNTPIRYRTDSSDQPPGRGTPPYLWFISRNLYATNSNWNYQVGPVLSF